MGTTTLTSKTTIINKTNVNESTIQNIEGILKTKNIATSTTSSNMVDLTIIIGKDYD